MAGERWHLPPEAEHFYGVDSWNIRDSPTATARKIYVLAPGEQFIVKSRVGDWLEVHFGSGHSGWVYPKLRTADGEMQVLAPVMEYGSLAISDEPPQDAQPAQPRMKRTRSAQQNLEWLISELRERRLRAMGAVTPMEKATADLKLQETMHKLEILGINDEQLLALDGTEPLREPDSVAQQLVDELSRQRSYPHADFTNPRAESCWLSTFFQSLWHSRVFHAAFEALISDLPRAPRGTSLGALQETWQLYKEAGTKPVPVNALVKAWGTGYGDCGEAMGKLQDAEDLKPLSDMAALVPVPWTGRAPTAEQLWELVSSMGVENLGLVALDFTFPRLTNAAMQTLALSLKPAEEADAPDLGPSLKLVAMICFMEDFHHYVVFCKSLSELGTWIFFNDLPAIGATRGAKRRFHGWDSVARACGRFGCCPKMLLYENATAAQASIEKLSGSVSPGARSTATRSKARGTGCGQM